MIGMDSKRNTKNSALSARLDDDDDDIYIYIYIYI